MAGKRPGGNPDGGWGPPWPRLVNTGFPLAAGCIGRGATKALNRCVAGAPEGGNARCERLMFS